MTGLGKKNVKFQRQRCRTINPLKHLRELLGPRGGRLTSEGGEQEANGKVQTREKVEKQSPPKAKISSQHRRRPLGRGHLTTPRGGRSKGNSTNMRKERNSFPPPSSKKIHWAI